MLRWAFDGLGVDAFKNLSCVISQERPLPALHLSPTTFFNLSAQLLLSFTLLKPQHVPTHLLIFAHHDQDQSGSFIIDSAGNNGV